MPDLPEVSEQFPPASWKVGDGEPILFPAENVDESFANRVVENERPFRRGSQLDDTGSKARRFTVTAIFDNGSQEPGIPDSVVLYPTQLNRLRRSFDVHETGELTLPSKGKIRAKALSYEIKEGPDPANAATCTFVWLEDNEDSVDLASLQEPSVRATAVRLAEQTQFSSEAEGAWDGDTADLVEFASELEGLIAAPGRAVEDLETQVRRNRRAVQRVIRAGEQLGRDVGGLFHGPRGGSVVRALRRFTDTEARSADERARSLPRLVPYVVPNDTSLMAIAGALRQPYVDLLDVNSYRLDDPLFIEAGTVIRIFAPTGAGA